MKIAIQVSILILLTITQSVPTHAAITASRETDQNSHGLHSLSTLQKAESNLFNVCTSSTQASDSFTPSISALLAACGYKSEQSATRVCESQCKLEPEDMTDSATSACTYTINLMWINRKFEPKQKYIHPSANIEKLKENLLNTAYSWAASNPKSTVNIWFDSAFLNQKAIENTQEIINAYMSVHPDSGHIQLKDVRSLPSIKDNLEIFSDKTPVYFRADLLRLMATLDVLQKSNHLTYFVYADLDVKPIPQELLFDAATLDNVNTFGVVMDRDDKLGFENGFHIMSNHKKNLLTAIDQAIIKLNIQRAYNALNRNLMDPWEIRKTPLEVLSQSVYYSYRRMFDYYCHLEGYGKLIVCPKEISLVKKSAHNDNYDFSHHGLAPFGLACTAGDRFGLHFTFNYDLQEVSIPPTKKISRPPAKGDYTDGLPDSERPIFYLTDKTKLILAAIAIPLIPSLCLTTFLEYKKSAS